MKRVLLAIVSLLLSAVAGGAAGNCLTDTLKADFQSGIANNVDTSTSPDNVLLTYTAGGGGSIDQQNTSFTANGERCSLIPGNNQWCGQTFTAGKSGSLSRIDLNLFCLNCTSAPPPMIISVRATSGGLPTGSDLASASLTITDYSGNAVWYSANYAAPTTVTAGTQYAIVIRPSTSLSMGAVGLSDSAINSFTGNDVYAGGAVVFSTNSGSSWSIETGPKPSVDGAFKTYVGSGGSSGYATAGDLISSTKDSNPGTGSTNWSTLSWTKSTPTGTSVRFQAAASNSSSGPFNFVGPDGTAGSYFTTSNASLSQFNGNRYLRYRAYLATTATTATPVLNDATACFSTVVAPDLSISNSDGVTTASPGGSVTYTITAANSAGASGVTGATVTDAFPASLTCNWRCTGAGGGTCASSGSGDISELVNLPGGASVTYTATCSIAASASGTLTNTASIAPPAGVTDPAPGNNSASDSDTLTLTADVHVTMSDGVDAARLGDVVSYVIDVTNAGPGTASVNVNDALPAQLSNGSWVCSGTGGATCAKASGNNNMINTSATIPAAAKVTYVYTATVSNDNSQDQFTNTASATLSSGTDPNPNNNSASDTDLLVVFLNGFDGNQTLAMNVAAFGGGGDAFTAQLGVDAALLNQLGSAPETVASGRSADGKSLFSVQLARMGTDVAMRIVTSVGDGVFSDVSPWRTVDLKQHVMGLAWQSASARGGDGYLHVATGNSQMSITGRNVKDPVTQLQVAVKNNIPWLVPIAP